MSGLPPILDPCCGGKMFYFEKDSPHVLYGDIRREKHTLCDGRVYEVEPDLLMDFKALPFQNDVFSLVVFDPPHLSNTGPLSWQGKKYGTLDKRDWPEHLKHGFRECWRVLRPLGTLIFKWNETQIPLQRVLQCFSQKPIFGHTTTANLKTHWMVFFKSGEGA